MSLQEGAVSNQHIWHEIDTREACHLAETQFCQVCVCVGVGVGDGACLCVCVCVGGGGGGVYGGGGGVCVCVCTRARAPVFTCARMCMLVCVRVYVISFLRYV